MFRTFSGKHVLQACAMQRLSERILRRGGGHTQTNQIIELLIITVKYAIKDYSAPNAGDAYAQRSKSLEQAAETNFSASASASGSASQTRFR